MSSIDSLLNPGAAERRTSQPHFSQTTTYEAADALSTLATLGSGQQYAPRRSSTHHAPVEPSPPVAPPPASSPTLEHYHHGSQSPEEQKRRQSLMARSSPGPILAPIQNLSTALQEQMAGEDEQPASAAIGADVSQIVPSGGEAGRDSTQDREPAFVRDEPTTAQIRRPESPRNASFIKDEPSATATATPRESTPAVTASLERTNSTANDDVDEDTLKALEVAKQADLGLRTKRTASIAESATSPLDSKASLAPPTKKRPAPSSATGAVKKKGTAKALKPSKKRKLDPEDPTARSVTPTSRTKSKSGKKGSQAGTPGLESSPAPDNSSQVHASDDDGESSEDHNLYCICKKPDNHKWMIGCDGGCDDWFHGDCVNMKQADEELVDRFICPLCEEGGRGHTTWKPMCRRDGCRKPARLQRDRESKYCTDNCGALFMTEQLQRTAGAKTKSKKAKKKGDNEEEPTPLGGVLRSKDLKALVDASPNIQTFKNLGTGVLTPPQTASPNQTTFDGFTSSERQRLRALHNEKSQLNDRLEALKDREKFVSMAKEQAVRVSEREKIKVKDFCGYDSRLSWSDAEFLLWRKGKLGVASFEFNTLTPTPEQIASTSISASTDTDDPVTKESICLRRRCSKHPQWQKLNLQDARFEELEVVEAVRECEKEERSVRERARRRGAKEVLAGEITAGDGDGGEGGAGEEGRNREGWVEVVGG